MPLSDLASVLSIRRVPAFAIRPRSRRPTPPRICLATPSSLQPFISLSPPSPSSQVQAKLIVVYTHTGQTAELVAKYRPPMPIMTMVVPHLVSDGLKWKLDGRWVNPFQGGRAGPVKPWVHLPDTISPTPTL